MTNKIPRTSIKRTRQAIGFLLAWASLAGVAVAQEITVQIESNPPVHVSAADLAGMPHQNVPVEMHAKAITFEAVPLRLVLEKAGVTFGESIRGKRLASYLLVECADGYRVVFALPELDPAFADRGIFLADRADGQPLDSKEGPYRLVIPAEKRMARWARQVTTIEVVQIP